MAAGAPPAVLTRTYDHLGRSTGFTLGTDYAVTYGYAADGRFGSVSASTSHLPPTTWNYAYLSGTDLLAGYTNSAGFAALRTYEPHRDLIASVANTFQGQPVGSFVYANDALARRVSRVDQSTISAPSVATNLFAYNARSELSSAQMGTNAYGYVYDPIGNRLTASNNAEALAYAANALNQYTNILSSAPPAPPREVSPLFDADGNLTNYNGWTYTWDAENRLILAVHGSTVVSNQYDYMSRRVAKTSGNTTHRFLYDGWAMIQEKTGTQTNSYVYGLDLSGSMQGAGTIGGILSASLNGTQAFYFYDANGNVSDLAEASGNSLVHYEWDPYGNAMVSSGNLAAVNPFRFSTKYTDDETGLVYYGYRFYSPGFGRLLSRDPIRENGFLLTLDFGKSFVFPGVRSGTASRGVSQCGRHEKFSSTSCSRRTMLEDRLSRLEDRYNVVHGRIAPQDPNLFAVAVNQPVNLIDPLGLDWVAPNPNMPPVIRPTPPYILPPITVQPVNPIGRVRDWIRSRGAAGAVCCVGCGVGLLLVEGLCANYSSRGYPDFQHCLCAEYDNNSALQVACSACAGALAVGFPVPLPIDMGALLGCTPRYSLQSP